MTTTLDGHEVVEMEIAPDVRIAAYPQSLTFNRRMDKLRTSTLRRCDRTFDELFDPDDLESLRRIGGAYAEIITAAQRTAITNALDYLVALGADLTPDEPQTAYHRSAPEDVDIVRYRIGPRIMAGWAAQAYEDVGGLGNSRPVQSLKNAAVTVFTGAQARNFAKGVGNATAQAAEYTKNFLNRIASTEPFRVANRAIANTVDRIRERFSRGRGKGTYFTGRFQNIVGRFACSRCVDAAQEGPKFIGKDGKPRGRETTRPLTTRAATVPVEQLFSISDDDERALRRSIERTFERIGATAAERLRAVRIVGETDPRDSTVGPRWAGWFDQASDRFDVSLRGPIVYASDQADWLAAQFVPYDQFGGKSWYINTAEPSSASDYVVTHELGHFLHRSLNGPQRNELLGAVNQVTAQMVEQAGNAAYAEAIAQGKTEAQAQGLANSARGRAQDLSSMISGYAYSQTNEFYAEAWAEYILSPNPGPMARAVGDTLTRLLAA